MGKTYPSLLINYEQITNFETKANIFNTDFASQCTIINNDTTLLSSLNNFTDDSLCSSSIFSEVIFQLIKRLDPNKAHRQNEVSVEMLKLRAPLSMQTNHLL